MSDNVHLLNLTKILGLRSAIRQNACYDGNGAGKWKPKKLPFSCWKLCYVKLL